MVSTSPTLGKPPSRCVTQPLSGGDALLLQRFAHQFLQFMQRQRPRRFPGVLARSRQQRFFLVELILNLADQFLQDVLQRHHAHRAAVFIHHNRQVQLPFQEELQQLFQPRRFGNINQLARRGQQVRPAPGFEPHRIQILDVNHPQRLVEVPALAQREAGVARLLRHVQALGDAGLGVQRDDFLPRPHDLARDAPAQVQRVQHDVPAQRGAAGLLLRRRQQQAQLLLGMRPARLAGQLDARPGAASTARTS